MRSQYVSDAQVPIFDFDVSNALSSLDDDFSGGMPMVIGFKNGFGEIYRKITVSGLAHLISFTNSISAIGLKDELLNEFGMREGCDAIFSRV